MTPLLLTGILIALVYPRLSAWLAERGYERAVRRQQKLLDDYDITDEVYWLLLGGIEGLNPPHGLVLNRQGIRLLKRAYPRKALEPMTRQAFCWRLVICAKWLGWRLVAMLLATIAFA